MGAARARAAVLLFVLSLPAAQASAHFAIDGDQRWTEPSLVEGLVWAAPDAATLGLAQPTHSGQGPIPILHSPHAGLVLHRQVVVVASIQGFPQVFQESTDDQLPEEATDLRIEWLGDIGQPQLLLAGAVDSGLGIRATRCTMKIDGEDGSFRFPNMENQPYALERESKLYEGRPEHLAATCRANSIDAATPESSWIYGMQLHVVGSDGLDEPVWTGTRAYDEPSAPTDLPSGRREGLPNREAGLFFRVTQILEVKRLEAAPMEVSLEQPTDVTLHAPGFFAAGNLAMGPSEGRLDWGEARLRGDIAPLVAEGAFEFRRGDDQRVNLEGRTVNGPVIARGAADGTPMLFALVALAGLSLASLLAGLWSLFNRLSAQDVLGHPRRKMILDLVLREPGVGVGAVARTLGLRWSKAAYHATRLERAGHIRCRRLGGRIALVPVAPGIQGHEAALALLGRPKFRRMHDLLHREPGLDQSGLAARLGFHKTRVTRMLAALREAHLVDVDQSAAKYRYRATRGEPEPTGSLKGIG